MRKIINPLNKIEINLKGNVKTCSESWHSRLNKETKEKTFRSKTVYYFDRYGKIFKIHNFEEDGVTLNIVYLKYNFKGKLVERKNFYPASKREEGFESKVEEYFLVYDDDGGFDLNIFSDTTSKSIYFYNSKGYLVKELDYLEERLSPKTKYYDYDEKNNLISLREFDFKGLDSRIISKFDHNGNLLNRKVLSPIKNTKKESIKSDNTYKYDYQGRLIEITSQGFFGRREKIIYKYDDIIREIKVSTFEWLDYYDSNPDYFIPDKLKNIMIYKYTNTGEVYEIKEFNSHAAFSGRTVYKYDDKGNMIEESNYDSDGNLRREHLSIKKNYAFDSEGNWRKMCIIDDYGPREIYERELEYY